MEANIDQSDARVLELLQQEIPLTDEPFREVAGRLSLDAVDLIERVSRLKQEGLIRRMGAIVDAAALGYIGALVAFRVAQDCVDEVGKAISAHSRVSHCYSRDGDYNLWFTLTVPPGGSIDDEVAVLASEGGVESSVVLPALKVFKLGVFLRLTDSPSTGVPAMADIRPAQPLSLSDEERVALRVLQEDLPATEMPFRELAASAGISEDALLHYAKVLLSKGVIRRFAAVLNHRKAGYVCNAMICWRVRKEEVEGVGRKLAEDRAVSHCYERPVVLDWPYPLYTMIHCRSESELGDAVERLAAIADGAPHTVLRTVREYKKSPSKYADP